MVGWRSASDKGLKRATRSGAGVGWSGPRVAARGRLRRGRLPGQLRGPLVCLVWSRGAEPGPGVELVHERAGRRVRYMSSKRTLSSTGRHPLRTATGASGPAKLRRGEAGPLLARDLPRYSTTRDNRQAAIPLTEAIPIAAAGIDHLRLLVCLATKPGRTTFLEISNRPWRA